MYRHKEGVSISSPTALAPSVSVCWSQIFQSIPPTEQVFIMASGVAIGSEVVDVYNQIKLRRQGENEMERFKLAMFCLSDDEKHIVMNHECSLKIKHVKNEENVFKKIVSMLPQNDCCYALYDCVYATCDSPNKQELVFIMSAPEHAPLKKKMIYASSKESLKKKFDGVKTEWQINDSSDKDISVLCGRFSGKVVSVEGKKL